MKNNFHDDVNNENLDIANRILEDSEKFNDINFSKLALDDIINDKQTDKKSIWNKGHIYAITSAIAACLIFVVGFGVWSQDVYKKKICGTQKLAQKNLATDYSEIYEKLMGVKSLDYEISESSALDGGVTKGSVSAAPVNAGKDTAKTSSNTGLAANENSDSFYDTNEQTESVHEGDIVKTDGKYIYTLKGLDLDFGTTLIITKVNGTKMNVVKELEIVFDNVNKTDSSNESSAFEDSIKSSSGYNYSSTHELYVYESTLIVIGTYYDYSKDDSYTPITYIYVYDISNPKDITLINKLSQEGSYVSSRMKDNFLYTVTTLGMNSPTTDCCVPKVNGKLMTPDCIYLPEEISNRNYTVITGLDVTNAKDFVTSQSVLGGSSNIYASVDNIYVINTVYDKENITKTKVGKDALEEIDEDDIEIYDNEKFTPAGYLKSEIKFYLKNYNIDIKAKDINAYKDTGVYKTTTRTEIIKFAYDDGNIKVIANSIIDGHTEDNLNFDEKDGYLRCVTTENSYTNVETLIKCYDKNGEFLFNFPSFAETVVYSEDTNNVFVLDENLNIAAEINNLAKGESIYSARYLGDYGYFVTYEETDPLFSVDFSDMENPKIIGKLKMPGYSEYLHFYGADKLLGFGLEESSDWNESDKLKLEMFNVEGGKAEKEAKTLLDDYYYSASMYNYKSMMVDPKRNLIGFTAEEEIELENDWNFRQYYLVYSYENDSFKEVFKIKIRKYAYDVRGFYIGDYLYVVCPEYGIYAINMKTYNEDTKVERVKFN